MVTDTGNGRVLPGVAGCCRISNDIKIQWLRSASDGSATTVLLDGRAFRETMPERGDGAACGPGATEPVGDASLRRAHHGMDLARERDPIEVRERPLIVRLASSSDQATHRGAKERRR